MWLALVALAALENAKSMGGFGSSMLAMSDAAILERLKTLYATKLRPLEEKSLYHELREPALSGAWFDARPMVLLLGQYSVGKTSFIRYLLGRNFPNQHVGPEPTTDRFVAVMYGDREKVTPGNALTSQPDTPFHSLRHYGTGYLDKLEAASVPAPILRRITLVDSPGVQAGEKQKGGRGYDFLEVIKWWAQHSDRVVLLFDPNKLDISDEFRAVLEELKVHQSKVRVILNKADEIEPQKLMRVYGALMWSLGSIIASPEVPRVYIGSFWDAPFREGGMRALMEAEESDLVQELASLPEDNVMNKINEIARRARLVQVHVHLMSYMREQVLSKWMGRKQAQEWVCSPEGMRHCYEQTQRQHSLSRGDFPDWRRLSEMLRTADFNQFYKPSTERSKKLRALRELMETDVPNLIQQLHTVQKRQGQKEAVAAFQPVRQNRPPTPSMLAREAHAREEQRESQRAALASATSRLKAAAAGLQTRAFGSEASAPPPSPAAPEPQAPELQAPPPFAPTPTMSGYGAPMEHQYPHAAAGNSEMAPPAYAQPSSADEQPTAMPNANDATAAAPIAADEAETVPVRSEGGWPMMPPPSAPPTEQEDETTWPDASAAPPPNVGGAQGDDTFAAPEQGGGIAAPAPPPADPLD